MNTNINVDLPPGPDPAQLRKQTLVMFTSTIIEAKRCPNKKKKKKSSFLLVWDEENIFGSFDWFVVILGQFVQYKWRYIHDASWKCTSSVAHSSTRVREHYVKLPSCCPAAN